MAVGRLEDGGTAWPMTSIKRGRTPFSRSRTLPRATTFGISIPPNLERSIIMVNNADNTHLADVVDTDEVDCDRGGNTCPE